MRNIAVGDTSIRGLVAKTTNRVWLFDDFLRQPNVLQFSYNLNQGDKETSTLELLCAYLRVPDVADLAFEYVYTNVWMDVFEPETKLKADTQSAAPKDDRDDDDKVMVENQGIFWIGEYTHGLVDHLGDMQVWLTRFGGRCLSCASHTAVPALQRVLHVADRHPPPANTTFAGTLDPQLRCTQVCYRSYVEEGWMSVFNRCHNPSSLPAFLKREPREENAVIVSSHRLKSERVYFAISHKEAVSQEVDRVIATCALRFRETITKYWK